MASSRSSNYELYGDMSERVMTVIESMVPAAEVYSIDEAFAELTGMPGDLERLGRQIRAEVISAQVSQSALALPLRKPWQSWQTTRRRNGRTILVALSICAMT